MTGVRTSLLWLALACSLLLTPIAAHADILLLMDGRQLKGELVEETAAHVMFRHYVAGFWTTEKFTRRQIDKLYPEEGDQSDKGTGEPAEQQPTPGGRPDNAHLPRVFVIPLHGSVGSAGDTDIRNTFDAHVLRQCLEEAQKQNAEAVLLEINSPGGLVSEMEAICEAILDFNSALRIVAYPRDAFSAAAIISLCCREMVVHPDARIGAAVIISAGPGGASALDAKLASPHHARQRQFMQRSGRPYEVVAAMTIMETELWWSEEEGFSTVAPDRPGQNGWACIDGISTVLTMTADDAVKWKLARASAPTVNAALAKLGITGDINIINMESEVAKYNLAMQRRFDELVRQLRVYFGSLGDLRDAIVDLGDAYSNKDRDAARKQKSIISQQVTRIQSSGRAIAKIDKSLLARRVDLPDVLLEQMKTDATVLGRISNLVKSDTYEGFNESVDRLNSTLDAWRKLLN